VEGNLNVEYSPHKTEAYNIFSVTGIQKMQNILKKKKNLNCIFTASSQTVKKIYKKQQNLHQDSFRLFYFSHTVTKFTLL